MYLHGIKVQEEKTDDENQNKTVYDVDPSVPELCNKQGKDNVLKQIDVEVPVSSEKVLGLVLDADQNPQDRWREVRARLQKFELDPPEEMPAHGYIADVTKYKPASACG